MDAGYRMGRLDWAVALFVAAHWEAGYGLSQWTFKAKAYPALGAITALAVVRRWLLGKGHGDLATTIFFAGAAVWVCVFLAGGWFPPGVLGMDGAPDPSEG